MPTRGNQGRLVPVIDPSELYGLKGNDRIEYDMATLGVDEDGTDRDVDAYLVLLNDLGKACTGLDTLGQVNAIEDIPITVSDAKHKACVVHAAGMFEDEWVDGLLMVVKENIYLQAVDHEVNGWGQVTDTQLAVRGAASLGYAGSYSLLGGGEGKGSRKLKLSLIEFKRAIVRLLKKTSTISDLLTVAVNMCEPVRYRFIAEKVVSTINNFQKPPYDKGETCDLCDICDLLIDNWGKIAKAADDYRKTKHWKCRAENNKKDEEKILTKEFVIQWVRVVKKPGTRCEDPPQRDRRKI
ncbi:uncharacterized protein LOC141591601 isoform X2 [Silene latifolia]|uniref:uncharacterized protein LOC141591601 isoform X2 n=1 Tax=Silene latifolia TaxID=37657 RepID=UPI003D772FF1